MDILDALKAIDSGIAVIFSFFVVRYCMSELRSARISTQQFLSELLDKLNGDDT